MYRTHTYVCVCVFNAEHLGKLISISCFSLLRLKYICGARQETPEQASKNLTQKHINKIYKISTRTHIHTQACLCTLCHLSWTRRHTRCTLSIRNAETHTDTHAARTTLWQQFYLFLYFPYPVAIKGSSGNAHTKREEIKKVISMTKLTFIMQGKVCDSVNCLLNLCWIKYFIYLIQIINYII